MKAFIGHSFDDKDKGIVDNIQKFIESTGIECLTGEKAQNNSIAQKVKERIADCEIFIGIFTCDKIICPHTSSKWFCKAKKRISQCTTSNWILQESGFAIGINREMILLVENGIDKFPELQGDMEVIFFDRNSISDKFLQLNQMIEGVKIKISGGTITKPSEDNKQIDTHPKIEEKEIKPEEEPKNKKDEILDKIYDILLVEKDYIKAQKMFDEEAKPLLVDKEEEARRRAVVLRISHSLGDKGAFEKLRMLCQNNPDYTGVAKQLAYRYKEIEEYKKAKELFLSTINKYDLSDPEQIDNMLDSYIEASWCMSYEGNVNEAIEELNKLLLNPNLSKSRAKIFETMARISKEKGTIEDFYIYAEASLADNPVDTSLRFTLAYAYSDKNKEKLGLLHYKKLIETTKSIAGLNNIGVSYSRLVLNAKSIENYLKATKEKHTLAMGNLAYRYTDAGFIDDAQKLIDKAYDLHKEGIEVDPNIAGAQKNIKIKIEEENKKEEEFLSEAKKESQYRVKYSSALCSENKVVKNQLEGIWRTSWGDLPLIYDQENGVIKVEYKKQTEEVSYWTGKPINYIKEEMIEVKGAIRNMSGKYTIEVNNEALAPNKNVYSAKGYMIINENRDLIEIMENTKDGKTKYEKWTKITDIATVSVN